MTAYINELLQETLQGKNDYNQLAGIIENYITKNNAEVVIAYEDIKEQCETLYLTIKGFESIH